MASEENKGAKTTEKQEDDLQEEEETAEETPEGESTQNVDDTQESHTTDFGIVDDLELKMSVILGTVNMPICELRKLGPGAVIKLDRKAGELVELAVNGKIVARCELINNDGNIGIVIKELRNR